MDWNMPDEILKRHERLTGKPAKTFVHLKSGHKLGKNFYKGIRGDRINVLLRVAAYDFEKI
jgi:hypothetical protein